MNSSEMKCAGMMFPELGRVDEMAMGFVLRSALATRLGVGFLPIRKAGKLCVATDKVRFSNYSGRTQDIEKRNPAVAIEENDVTRN